MKQIKDFRTRQPRLTLGLGDQQSIAEAFSEEAANIGSNVSGGSDFVDASIASGVGLASSEPCG
jgi:hypothetical protein